MSSKSICERYNKHNSDFYSCKSGRTTCRPIKKVIPSRKLGPDFTKQVKSCSTGVINNKNTPQITRAEKVTKSVMNFGRKKFIQDFCAKCGDSKTEKRVHPKDFNHHILDSLCQDIETQVAIDKERSKHKNMGNSKKLIQKYKNENFRPSITSMKTTGLNKILDPIKEGTEDHVSSDNSDKSFEIYSDSLEEIGYLDPEDSKTIEHLKDFREKNYFECHSAKSRISSKGSVTSLNNHKCVYRFYLNDRLFPVPLHTDHLNNIRCIECHLPLDDVYSNSDGSINGTIQTKVKIDNEVQDMILMLPVKKPLIIEEKKRRENENGIDALYFGIVKLNYDGDSVFNRTQPSDSLALRYQKGFKEFVDTEKYQYEKVHENDVIII